MGSTTPQTLAAIYDALEAAMLTSRDPAPPHGSTSEQWDAWREDRAQYYDEQAQLWEAVRDAPDLDPVPSAARLLLVMAAGGHAWDNRNTAQDLRKHIEGKGATGEAT